MSRTRSADTSQPSSGTESREIGFASSTSRSNHALPSAPFAAPAAPAAPVASALP
jgi:hypothetical protein